MSSQEVRQRLAYLHAYAGLYFGLDGGDHGSRNPKVREMLNGVGDFIRAASPEDVTERGAMLCSILEKGTPPNSRIRPRRAREELGRDFVNLGKDYDVWRYGVTYAWLLERFEPPVLWLPTDLPGHARVGLGVHASTAATEEVALLDDAFFLHALVGEANGRMWSERRKVNEPESASELAVAHQMLTRLNMNVGTYARLTVLTAVAFVESFVNSVGTEASRRQSSGDPTVLEQLQGTRKGRHLSLEFKLERYPALIRPDAQSPLRILDEAQRQEPFRRFLAETKEVRDASMHFGPSKAPIICTPQEWLTRAENALTDALAVARAFWNACYPAGGFPDYIYALDDSTFRQRAAERLPRPHEHELGDGVRANRA